MANALAVAMGAKRKKPMGDVENAADARQPGDPAEDSSPIKLNPAHKGSLHTALGVAQGSPVPAAKLSAATRSASANLRRKAIFAQNAKSWGK